MGSCISCFSRRRSSHPQNPVDHPHTTLDTLNLSTQSSQLLEAIPAQDRSEDRSSLSSFLPFRFLIPENSSPITAYSTGSTSTSDARTEPFPHLVVLEEILDSYVSDYENRHNRNHNRNNNSNNNNNSNSISNSTDTEEYFTRERTEELRIQLRVMESIFANLFPQPPQPSTTQRQSRSQSQSSNSPSQSQQAAPNPVMAAAAAAGFPGFLFPQQGGSSIPIPGFRSMSDYQRQAEAFEREAFQIPQDGTGTRPAPPASQKAIRQIPMIQVTSEDLTDDTNRECCICLEE